MYIHSARGETTLGSARASPHRVGVHHRDVDHRNQRTDSAVGAHPAPDRVPRHPRAPHLQLVLGASDPNTGLTPDRWPTKSFSSVAAIGFALTAYPVGVERGYVSRADAATRTLNTLRFMYNAPQGPQPTNVTGYKGFFYHFLDMQTGYRFQQVELSTIDTSLLLGGVLFCQSYFTGADPTENAIRAYADSIYLRIDWQWAVHNSPLVSMGWHPESGFINSDWKGYDEGMIVYILALGSPTHPIDPAGWTEWTRTYVWMDFYGQPLVNFPPLFGHQYSHVWIDFRGIQDAYMRGKGIDYFENSRRATISQRLYAIDNPAAVARLRGQHLGIDRGRWSARHNGGDRRQDASVSHLHRARRRRRLRDGRRHSRCDRSWRLRAVRAGDRCSRAGRDSREVWRQSLYQLWIRRFLQSYVSASDHTAPRTRCRRSGVVRHRLSGNRSGADHRDDRELPE